MTAFQNGDLGLLAGIARRAGPRLPMEEIGAGRITAEKGLDGDHKGPKFPRRQITLLAREDWEAALADLADLAGPVPLPWTARRANLLVESLRLPRGEGSIVRIGSVRLEVTAQTYPCRRMDEVHHGLLKALAPDWRGGVTTRVLAGGFVRIGDTVEVELRHTPRPVRLPG